VYMTIAEKRSTNKTKGKIKQVSNHQNDVSFYQ